MIERLLKPSEAEGRTVVLSEKQKRAQLDRKIDEQQGRCYYCRRVMNREYGSMLCATRDHRVPQPAGCRKDERDENIVAACFACNSNKGSKRLPTLELK